MLRICWFLLRKNIALLHVVSVGLKKLSNVEHNSHQLIAENSHPGKNCLYGWYFWLRLSTGRYFMINHHHRDYHHNQDSKWDSHWAHKEVQCESFHIFGDYLFIDGWFILCYTKYWIIHNEDIIKISKQTYTVKLIALWK